MPSNAVGIYAADGWGPHALRPDAYTITPSVAPPTERFRWSAMDRGLLDQEGWPVETNGAAVSTWREGRTRSPDWAFENRPAPAHPESRGTFVVAADGHPGVLLPATGGLATPSGRPPPTDVTVFLVLTIPNGDQPWPDWRGTGVTRSSLDGAAVFGVWSDALARPAGATAGAAPTDWEWSVRANAPDPYDAHPDPALAVRRLWVRRAFWQGGAAHVDLADAPGPGNAGRFWYRDGGRLVYAHRVRAAAAGGVSEFHRVTSLNSPGWVLPMADASPTTTPVLDPTTAAVPADLRWCLGSTWLTPPGATAPEAVLVPMACIFHEVVVHTGALTDAQLTAEYARLSAKWNVNPDTVNPSWVAGSYDASAWSTLVQTGGAAATGAVGQALARWRPALGSSGDLQPVYRTTLPTLQASATSGRLGVFTGPDRAFWDSWPTTSLPILNVTVALAFEFPGVATSGGTHLFGRRESVFVAGTWSFRREGDRLSWYIGTDAWRLVAQTTTANLANTLYVVVWTLRVQGATLVLDRYVSTGAADPTLCTDTLASTGYRAFPSPGISLSWGGYAGSYFYDADPPGVLLYETVVFNRALTNADMLGACRVLRRKWEV